MTSGAERCVLILVNFTARYIVLVYYYITREVVIIFTNTIVVSILNFVLTSTNTWHSDLNVCIIISHWILYYGIGKYAHDWYIINIIEV